MNNHRFTPLLMAVSAVVGIGLGAFLAAHFSGARLSVINAGGNKFENLLELIEGSYVDTVDMQQIVETALPGILAELDPHSKYIPASEARQAEDDLRGSFYGIGVSFTMQHDTVNVMSLIKGGPAEKAGVMPGDRITKADTTSLVRMRQDSVMLYLRGDEGTKVRLTIVRKTQPKPFIITVTRGEVPTLSVNVAYMIDDKTGYVRVKSFGENTYGEFILALARLTSEGMERLIVDLRGNTGGYMETAVSMANEFLPASRLIVYTEGRRSPRKQYKTDGRGQFKKLPLTVLIDEGSASASEIFAGAIQDNDRGLILGRRSFGKGLVQQQMAFKDGSIVRLTIARYYTPSGRCIQKPYVKGHDEDYENDLMMRYERGEFFSADSIHQSGPEYYTRLHRVVYGGGGIMPDEFIPEDTTRLTSYYREAVYQGLTREFAFEYTDQYRPRLLQFETTQTLERFLQAQHLVEKFAAYAEQHGLRRRPLMLEQSRPLFTRTLLSNIIYNVMTEEEYQEYLNEDDPAVLRAQKILKEGKATPTKP